MHERLADQIREHLARQQVGEDQDGEGDRAEHTAEPKERTQAEPREADIGEGGFHGA